MTQASFPSSLAETYAYDAIGNLTSKTDRKGQTITYLYDALNRMTQKTYPDTSSVEYVYDLVGKVMQVNDPTGTYGFAYDNMGRLIGTTTSYSFLPGQTFTNSYSYDAASNRTGFTAPDSSTNTYTYDSLNRLSNLTNSLTGSFGFSYDALSRRTQLTRPNGVNTNYAYDNLSRLLSVLHQAGSTTLDGASYTYDNAGNRVAKTNYLNNVTEGYSYDPLYQLTQVTQGASTTESYSYDAVGNRLSSLGVSPYSYNSSNELTATPSATYTYDNNGNTISKADSTGTTNYTWDFENRLTQVMVPQTGGGSNIVTFKYDPFGRRIQKSGPLGVTNYLHDKKNLLEEIDQTGNVITRYSGSTGIDEPLTEVEGGTVSYYEQDGLGSVTSLGDATGALAGTHTYDGFGQPTASTGTQTTPFQYTGREFDPETGLDFDRARYYDPKTGRFVSEDPAGFLGGINKYAYVLNRPINFSDPTGLDCPEFPMDCVHSPDERAQMQREHDQMMQQILSPNPTPLMPDSGTNAPPSPATPNEDCRCHHAEARPKSDLEAIAVAYSHATHALDLLAVNGSIFFVAGAQYVASASVISLGCLDPTPFEPATCAAGVFAGGVMFTSGTGSAAYGVWFFTHHTLPAIKGKECD